MKLSPLSLSIFRHTWAIDPLYAFQIWPALEELRTGRVELSGLNAPKTSNEAFSANAGTISRYTLEAAPKGSVAVLGIKGSLMKDDQECGPDGMDTIGRLIQAVNKMSNIGAIVLLTDTPGGTVDGVEVLSKIIKNSKKPIITFVSGMMASAGVWIGSHATEVWASNDYDEIGSVGVLASFMDLQPYYESMGAKFHKIVSSHSPDKTKMMDDIRKGIYDGFIHDQLDPLALRFQEVVRENRPLVKDEHLTGKIFFAKDVMGVFVDKIGSLEEAIARAQELAKVSENSDNIAENEDDSGNNELQINMKKMKQFAFINKVLKVEQMESHEGSVSLNEEQLNAIEAALSAAENLQQTADETENKLSDTQAKQKKAQNDLAAALTALDDIDDKVKSAEGLDGKLSAVKEILAARPAVSPTGAAGSDNGQKEDTDWDTIDALEHNKEVE